MPKLTVMMPAKNAAPTIQTAVLSCLRAMPRDSELVVWDDASTDDTLDMLSRLSDPRIRVIPSDRSVGSGAARAEIMNRTDSDLVSNMDADDITLPGRYRISAQLLRTSDVVFGQAIRFGTGGTRPAGLMPGPRSVFRWALLFHNPIVHSTMTARRRSIERAGGYTNLRRGQDYDLWLRAAARGARFAHAPVPLAAYRQSRSQISRSAGYEHSVGSDVELATSYKLVLAQLADDLVDPAPRALRDLLLYATTLMDPLRARYYRRLISQGGVRAPLDLRSVV